jgi:hypothetical protein
MWKIRTIFLLGLLAALCGCPERKPTICPTTRAAEPAQTQEVDCQKVDEMDFLDCMARKTKCTVADAVRAVCMLVTGGDVGKTYEERYQYLADRGIIRPAWKLRPDQWINRGTLGYMLYKTAQVRGGVNMALFGSWGLGDRRYAYREMKYLELMQDGVDYNYVSGPELVTAMGKVDRFMQEHGKCAAPASTDLGESPHSGTP